MMRIRLLSSFRRAVRAVTAGSLAFAALFASPTAARAQLIEVKTLRFADGDQFSFFPAANLGIVGVSIAIADSIHDPFVNPAKGARLRGSYFFGTPTFFSVSRKSGGGNTLPVGVVGRSGTTFGAVAVAIQSITDVRASSTIVPPPPGILTAGRVDGGISASDDSHANRYAFVMLGRTFSASKLAIGASALLSGLGSIDGVPLLYADSRSVRQTGGSADIRFGMLKEWNGGQSLEALLLHRHVGLSQNVTYADAYWDALERRVVESTRLEQERERTNTSGIHLQYEHPLFDSGWRLGAMLTANRLDQPATPRYEIASIPSDRGHSSAFDLGIGLARSSGGSTLAVDAIYEPIRSHLVALSDSAALTSAGATIQAGATAIDNRLRFSNATLRAGVSHDFKLEDDGSVLRLQFGVQARSIYYTLDQHDLIRGARRGCAESWTEWTRGWGWILRLPAVELQYTGRLTTGAERPVAPGSSGAVPVPVDFVSGPFRVPRTSATTLRGVRVMTHQLSVSLPIR